MIGRRSLIGAFSLSVAILPIALITTKSFAENAVVCSPGAPANSFLEEHSPPLARVLYNSILSHLER